MELLAFVDCKRERMDAGGGNEADIAVWRQSCLACGLERSLGFRCSDPVVDLCGRSLLRILNFFFFFFYFFFEFDLGTRKARVLIKI